jgi:hypothetical protein
MMRDLMDRVDVDHGPDGTTVTLRRQVTGRPTEEGPGSTTGGA